jgi:hypothetical protein
MSETIIKIPSELENKTLEWINAQNYLQSNIHIYYIENYLNEHLPKLKFIAGEYNESIGFDKKWKLEEGNYKITIVVTNTLNGELILVWDIYQQIGDKKTWFRNYLKEPAFKCYYILKKLNELLIQMQEAKTNENSI